MTQPGAPPVSEERVLNAIRQVIDPELGVNLVDLGLIYDVRITEGDVAVRMTLTTRGCPLHGTLVQAVERVLPGLTGRGLRLNVSAAIPAVLLDVGFPAEALRGVPILARCAGLIGHLTGELANPIGFALSHQATREARYTGEWPGGRPPRAEG